MNVPSRISHSRGRLHGILGVFILLGALSLLLYILSSRTSSNDAYKRRIRFGTGEYQSSDFGGWHRPYGTAGPHYTTPNPYIPSSVYGAGQPARWESPAFTVRDDSKRQPSKITIPASTGEQGVSPSTVYQPVSGQHYISRPSPLQPSAVYQPPSTQMPASSHYRTEYSSPSMSPSRIFVPQS